MSLATKILALAAPLFACAFVGTASGDALPYHARAMASVGVELPVADRVLVRKSERRLYLMRGDDVLRAYRVALGLNPGGPKERAGDFRTPEGSYRLTRRNTRSDFFLSIQVSYPSPQDVQRARIALYTGERCRPPAVRATPPAARKRGGRQIVDAGRSTTVSGLDGSDQVLIGSQQLPCMTTR